MRRRDGSSTGCPVGRTSPSMNDRMVLWVRAYARGMALSRYGPQGGEEDCCGAVYRAAARFLTDLQSLPLWKAYGREAQGGCAVLLWWSFSSASV